MGNTNNVIFDKIIEYIKLGDYTKAYEFSLESKCEEKSQIKKLNCFRILLACINDKTHLPTYEFSWNSANSSQTELKLRDSKMKKNIDCCNEMFDELKQLCFKYQQSKK